MDRKLKEFAIRALPSLVSLAGLLASPVQSAAQAPCVAPALSDQEVATIVEQERATRVDLPARPAQYRATVGRRRCHYVYVESSVPERPELNNIFILNQYGLIVDATPSRMACPGTSFEEAQLAAIVSSERALRPALPTPFPSYSTNVARLRCLYLYIEIAEAPTDRRYQVFAIDPLGELLGYFREQP